MQFKLKGNQQKFENGQPGPPFMLGFLFGHMGAPAFLPFLLNSDSVVLLVEAFQYRSAILNPKE